MRGSLIFCTGYVLLFMLTSTGKEGCKRNCLVLKNLHADRDVKAKSGEPTPNEWLRRVHPQEPHPIPGSDAFFWS